MSWPLAVTISVAWWATAAFLLLRLKFPRPLPTRQKRGPFVSVIVPARNEARNIVRCVRSLCASEYAGGFEVIVVDDRSRDGTGSLARSVKPGRAESLRVLEGSELPSDWTGKPWACHQGLQAARGEWLLFTDADTWHAPELLGLAAAAMEEDDADLLTLAGRQETDTFWERLLQPSFFFLIAQAYPDTSRPFRQRRWRRSLANGQFLLARRSAYSRVGGHRAVSAAVVEDLRFAQLMTREGCTVVFRGAREVFATRMYRSLGEIFRGWSKNVAVGARLTVGSARAATLLPVALVIFPAVLLAPSVVMAAGVLAGAEAPWIFCAGLAALANVGMAAAATWRMGISPAYALLQPLAALLTWCVLFHSTLRGSRVRWKGRAYKAETSG